MKSNNPVNATAAAEEAERGFLTSPEVAAGCPRLLQLATQHVADNRGVGGTRSDMAGYCLKRLVPCASQRSPDLLLADYAVNDWIMSDDTVSGSHSASIERLIRQILLTLPNTAVVLTNFPGSLSLAGQNAEPHYRPSAQLYHVPEISMRRWMEEFLLQPGYQPEHPWHASYDWARRLLPNNIPLPIPHYVHEKGKDMDFNQALWHDEFHISDAGHQLLASLANKEILRYVENLRATEWTSITDPIFDDYARQVAPHAPFLSRPVEPLPAPLEPIHFALDAAPYQCFVLYWPYQPRAAEFDHQQAEAYLQVAANSGWVYAQSRHAHNKFAMVVDADHSAILGQRLSIELPSAAHSVVVAHLRTWNVVPPEATPPHGSAATSAEATREQLAQALRPPLALPSLECGQKPARRRARRRCGPSKTEQVGLWRRVFVAGSVRVRCAILHVEHTTEGRVPLHWLHGQLNEVN